MKQKYLWLFVTAILLAGCGETVSDKLVVSDAYLRETPAGKKVTAGFMRLQNNTSRDCHLLGGSAEFAGAIEVHAHRHEQGRMRMEKLDALVIESGGSVALTPGGLHLMVMGINRPLQKQQRLPVVLQFSDCPDQQIEVVVKSVLDE